MAGRITLKPLLPLFAVLLLGTAGASFTARAADPSPTAALVGGWQADLNLFASELPRRHANAFHHISRRTFDADVEALRHRLQRIDADQFWVGLDQIESAIGDGHTFMRMPADAPRYGLDLKRFGDDYRVIAVAPDVRGDGILGARLVAIDGTSVTDVRKRVLMLTPQDELQPLRDFRSQALLTNGLVLHGLRIATRRDVATYRFEGEDGRQIDLVVHAGPLAPRAAWTTLPTHAADAAGDQSLHCAADAGSATVTCAFRSYDDLEHTSARIFDAVRESRAHRLVIDMRENNGGNFCKGLQYLVQPIAADPMLNRRGALYVMIGQQTFSAAMSNAAHFRQLTQATLVGQPIGEKPNSYQEIEDLHLPNTGWDARYSSRFYRFAKGRSNIIRPDVEVALTWSDYKQGKDAAMAYIAKQPANAARVDRRARITSAKPAGDDYCKEP